MPFSLQDTVVGTQIMRVSATDVDEGDNQKITYDLVIFFIVTSKKLASFSYWKLFRQLKNFLAYFHIVRIFFRLPLKFQRTLSTSRGITRPESWRWKRSWTSRWATCLSSRPRPRTRARSRKWLKLTWRWRSRRVTTNLQVLFLVIIQLYAFDQSNWSKK